jgi:hypothetical protein
MGQTVKIKLRPGQVARFPAVCIHCGQAAAAGMLLRRRIGRTTRLLEVPVCTVCKQELQQLSAEEERLQKVGRLATGTAAVLAAVLLLILLPSGLAGAFRLLVALLLALLPAAAVFTYFKRAAMAAARPAKKAVIESARMAHFSWRATTFEFTNDSFAQQFRQLNESLLMDI